MKKNYKTPKSLVCVVNPSELICDSPTFDVQSNKNGGAPTTAEGKYQDWEEED